VNPYAKELRISLACNTVGRRISDISLKDKFDTDELPQFWLLMKNDYPRLSDKVIKVLLLFVTKNLWESVFSAVALMKTKCRLLFLIENELRDAIS
jgi:hypothetical protein